MRKCVLLVLFLGIAIPLFAQDTSDLLPPDRYGIASNPKLYPQGTPKESLETVTKLLENKRFEYLLAHVMDHATVDAMVQDRAKLLRAGVQRELLIIRDEQQKNIDRYERDVRLPTVPEEFAEKVQAEATKRAFKQLVKEAQETLTEFPDTVKTFRKYLREGTVNDMGGNVSFSHKDVPLKFVNFKRDGKRWFLDDKQQEDLKPMPPMPVPMPKEK